MSRVFYKFFLICVLNVTLEFTAFSVSVAAKGIINNNNNNKCMTYRHTQPNYTHLQQVVRMQFLWHQIKPL